MAQSFPRPRLSKNKQNTQLSYELPQRIHTAKAYPVKASNGSSVIIYGHEKGVKIIWRGGRPFKPPVESPTTSKKSNGANNAVVLLDSDDEPPPTQGFQDTPEFEDEEEEIDPSRPYPDTLQVLDLYLGTDVLHVALLPSSILGGPKWHGLAVLKQKIVFTAACADNLVRLITVPLTPPSPASKARSDLRSNFTQANAGNGSWGETVRLLGGHQKTSDGVTMTLEFASGDADDGKTDSTLSGAHIIIASHSREVAGLLHLYRVPISSASSHFEPFQTIYLPSPAKSISFNPSLSKQRSSHLLVADTVGACRIYDFRLLIRNAGSEDPATENTVEQGTWLLSLYPGFQSSKEDISVSQNAGAHSGFGRKTIVDAKWVSGGKAIIVLLNDGEWGVWDIEGVGPGTSQGLLGRRSIKGGSISEFSLTGLIDGTAKARGSGPSQAAGSKFVPMTPGTRKATEPFGGKIVSGPIRGQISVVELPTNSPTNAAEDSIVFWFGDSFTIIPSLAKYWATNARKSTASNPFSGTPGSRATKLEGIDLQGELCSGIDQIVRGDSSTVLPSDVLILGEHRFTILTTRQANPQFQTTGQLALVQKEPSAGELDVVGIDEALFRMENGGTNTFAARLKGAAR